MPQITVRSDHRHVDFPAYHPQSPISLRIAEIVAKNLTCDDEGGAITADDIEVEFKRFGATDKTNGMLITVQIVADEFPSRKANLQARNDEIARALKDLFKEFGVIKNFPIASSRKAFVWTLLMPAGFTEFEI